MRGIKKLVFLGLFILISVISMGVYVATEAFNSLVVPPKPIKAIRVEQSKPAGYSVEVLGYKVELDVNPLLDKAREAGKQVNDYLPAEKEVRSLRLETKKTIKTWSETLGEWWSRVQTIFQKEKIEEKVIMNN